MSGTMRYWDGAAWSEHTATGYHHTAPAASVYAPYQRTMTSRPQLSWWQANTQSLVAIGFALGYVVLAMTAGVVMLGIIPVMAAVRALSAKEPLAPVALVFAIGAIAMSVLSFTGG